MWSDRGRWICGAAALEPTFVRSAEAVPSWEGFAYDPGIEYGGPAGDDRPSGASPPAAT
jgi:hypothetical protein